MASRLPWAVRRSGLGRRPLRRGSSDSTGGRTWACPTAVWSRPWPRREKLAVVFRRTRPRWIFAPYWVDAHPDHVAATELIEAARFWAKLSKTDMPGEPYYPQRIYYYFCVHLRLVPQPAFVLDISDFWEKKREAIECYRSQFIEGRPSDPPTFIDRLRDQAATWGFSIGALYGEPFATREPVGLSSLRTLL